MRVIFTATLKLLPDFVPLCVLSKILFTSIVWQWLISLFGLVAKSHEVSAKFMQVQMQISDMGDFFK